MLRAHVRAAADASIRPARTDRFLAYGPDPLRILLIGSGLAVGHGVATRTRALDGQVGARLAERSGRGVIVNNRSDDRLRLGDQVLNASTGDAFALDDIVIWCPSYIEMSERPWSKPWTSQMQRLLDAIPVGRQLIVVELPVPCGAEPTVVIARPIIERINRGLRSAVARRADTAIVAPPPVQVKPLGLPLFDAAYYSAAAETVVAVALEAIGRTASLTGPAGR